MDCINNYQRKSPVINLYNFSQIAMAVSLQIIENTNEESPHYSLMKMIG